MVNYALLKTAADESGDLELAGQVPRLLEEGINAAGRRYLVMSVAQAATGETRAFTPGHERFLASLGKTRFRSTDFEVSGCSERLRGALARLEGRVPGKTLATLHEAYHECETALVYWTGPYIRGASLPGMALAAARDRRAHAGVPARRAAAPRGARAAAGPQRPGREVVLEADRETLGLDAEQQLRRQRET